ncbi:Panacea domain-containing protein [Abyssibius alkaniclasticus]|uniref:Panacea domain-containing protein n=1 Tax=Abyssibius alkaniclasticus TaxID=2881234 RepID=UPI004058359D
MYSAFDVAGTLCDRSDWQLSNLSIQKLVYLAHMIHLGEGHGPLVSEKFEAWDYGPVIPSLYHELKMFGSDHVARYASLGSMEPNGKLQEDIIDYIVDLGKTKKPGQLVALTHWRLGAWAKNYEKHIKGLVIPNSDIEQEYKARMAD